MRISKTLLLILLTMMLRESLERLSQQERCIAGLEAQLAEAKIAKEELAKVEENNNNSRKMIGQMKDKLTKSEKKRSKEEPKVEVSGGVVGRRGSSSSREFHTGEEDEVVVVSFPLFSCFLVLLIVCYSIFSSLRTSWEGGEGRVQAGSSNTMVLAERRLPFSPTRGIFV